MRSSKKIRPFLCAGLTFFLSISILLIASGIELHIGYGTQRVMRDAISTSGYADYAREELSGRLQELLVAHGLSMEAGDVVAESDSYVDFNQYLADVYEDKANDRSSASFEKTWTEAFEKYFAEEQVELTDEVQASVTELTAQAGTLYSRYVYPEFVQSIHGYMTDTWQVLRILIIVSAIVTILLAGLLLKLFHYKHRAVRYISVALFTAALWNAAGVYLLGTKLTASALGIGSQGYLEFLNAILRAGRLQGYLGAGVLAVLGAISVLIGRRLKHAVR